MTEILYDESRFPEYEGKIRMARRRTIQTALAAVTVYLLFVVSYAIVLFPNDPLQAKVLVALYWLVVPIIASVLPVVFHSVNRRHPRRVTEEAIEAVMRWPLTDIQEVIWLGPAEGVEIRLDPEKYRMETRRIRGENLIRPEEFLRAVEGRVPVKREEAPSD